MSARLKIVEIVSHTHGEKCGSTYRERPLNINTASKTSVRGEI